MSIVFDDVMDFRKINQLPRIYGVYFILENGEPVYIGKSKDIWARWNTSGHHKLPVIKELPSADIGWIACRQEALYSLEKHFLKRFEPRLNGSLSKIRFSRKGRRKAG